MPRIEDRLRRLAEKRRQGEWWLVYFAGTTNPPDVEKLKPGEIRRRGDGSWAGRSEDGSQAIVTLLVVVGYMPSDEEIVERVRALLAQLVVEAAARPKHPRTSPKPTGRVSRTLAAREAVAKAATSVVRTRLAKCDCGARVEVPVGDADGICTVCGRGGL